MKSYGLRYLYKNIGKVIKKLPFAITFHGRVIAVVVKPTEIKPDAIDSHPRS